MKGAFREIARVMVQYPCPEYMYSVMRFQMKKDIQPNVYKATITCACGHSEQVLSTKGEQVHVEVCSACHPFFTGKQRFLDTAGRIDRFRKKYAKFEKQK